MKLPKETKNVKRTFIESPDLSGLVFVVLVVIGSILYSMHVEREIARDKARTDKIIERFEQRNETPSEPAEAKPEIGAPKPNSDAVDGHWHGDEWHAAPHTPSADGELREPHKEKDNQPRLDPVAAWQHLDAIDKNRHQWGQFSPRAVELMAQLTPVPEWVAGEGEKEIELLEELCALRDPRSAELLVSYEVDSNLLGRPPVEALVAMGPASVPALVARLDVDKAREEFLATPIELLPRIVAKHRSELGGIVEHIIIPKLEAIATLSGDEGSTNNNRVYARKALVRLQKIAPGDR